MGANNPGRIQITGAVRTVALAVAIPALLAACGGGNDVPGGTTVGTPPPASGPPAPTNSVALAWDVPLSTTDLAGYRLYYGTASGSYQQAYGQGISVGNVTTYTLQGLSHGTRYYFAVTAVDFAGNETAYSNEAFKDIHGLRHDRHRRQRPGDALSGDQAAELGDLLPDRLPADRRSGDAHPPVPAEKPPGRPLINWRLVTSFRGFQCRRLC